MYTIKSLFFVLFLTYQTPFHWISVYKSQCPRMCRYVVRTVCDRNQESQRLLVQANMAKICYSGAFSSERVGVGVGDNSQATCVMWHVRWHMIHGTWYMAHATWHMTTTYYVWSNLFYISFTIPTCQRYSVSPVCRIFL